jgi:hypothetical protein
MKLINKVKLENDSIMLSIELPRGKNGQGRSFEIILEPKTQTNPIASIGLNYEAEGDVLGLCSRHIQEDISDELCEALESVI